MSEELLSASVEQVITGLLPGFTPAAVPLWEDARNVRFDPAGVHSMLGFSQMLFSSELFDSATGLFDAPGGLFDAGVGSSGTPMAVGTTEKITGIYQMRPSSGAPRVFAGTLTRMTMYEGGSTNVLSSSFTGLADATLLSAPTYWSFCSFGNWAIFTNGVQAPQIYKTGATCAALGGTPPSKAEIVRKLGPHVLLYNTVNGTNMMEWCAEGEPEQWDPVTYPTAGRLPLQDLENPIVAVEPLGDTGHAVYTNNEMQTVRYQGGTFLFGARIAGQSFGAASKNAIVPVGSLHYGIDRNGVFKSDGTQFIAVSFPAFGSWLERSINWDQAAKIAGYHSKDEGSVKWVVPLQGSSEPNLVITFNYRTEKFTLSDLVFSVGQESTVFSKPIVGRFQGKVDFAENTPNDRGTPIRKFARTKPLDLGSAERMKFLDAITALITVHSGAGPLLYVRPLYNLSEGELTDAAWLGPFAPEEMNTLYNIMFEAPYFQLEFRSESLDSHWQVAGFKALGTLTGRSR